MATLLITKKIHRKQYQLLTSVSIPKQNIQLFVYISRFYGFRRLRYNMKSGQLAVAGFCDPHSKVDVTSDDADMWEASAENAPDGLSPDQAKYCLELLKADFDLILKQERKAIKENTGEANVVSWKRVVQGVSESCDVCDATLFNLHWACPRCGFVVCLECYVGRKNYNNLLNGDTKSKNLQCFQTFFEESVKKCDSSADICID